MTAAFAAQEVERFRCLIGRHLGLAFDETKLAFLADVLERHARGDVASYLARLEREGGPSAWRSVAQELTVNETYFFRNVAQLHAFVDIVRSWRGKVAPQRLRVLSAGCSSGEEAYSLAILAKEALASAACELSLLAVDIHPAMLEKAARGRYAAWSLRETPAEVRARYFRLEGRDYVLDASVRDAVSFEERNLVVDDAAFFRPGAFDVVFCRNVIMYFSAETARAVIGRVARSLTPGGLVFLGHAETMRGISQDFHLRHTHGTFYYELRDRGAREADHDATHVEGDRPGLSPIEDLLATDDSWAELIRRAAERVRTLTAHQRPSPRTAGRAGSLDAPPWDLAATVDLLRSERFAEARATLDALPSESARDPDVLLLHAVLLTNGGDVAEAERACGALLEIDELSAGAHYVLALCRENAGDRAGAMEHDRVAIYLDPTFAMPRLHLGLLARREKSHEVARRELGQALALLEREDASRLLLFGGGFTREALVTLCRGEIVAAGGAS